MIVQRKGKPDVLRDKGYIDGYIHKEAAPSATELSAAIGAALGIGSGTLANFVLSKMLGYEGNWMNYVGSGLAGGLAGGLGGAAAGDAVKKRIDYYRANPGEAGDILRKIEQDPRLRKVGDALRKNPLMRPIRRALGRPIVSLKRPLGYDVSEIKETFRKSVDKRGLLKTLVKAMKGERLWEVKGSLWPGTNKKMEELPQIFLDTIKMREQAFKSYFDLPTDQKVMDQYFVVDPEDKKRWRYSDTNPLKSQLDDVVRREFAKKENIKTKGSSEFIESRPPRSGFVGGFRATKEKGDDIAKVRDVFDFYNAREGLGYRPNLKNEKGKPRTVLGTNNNDYGFVGAQPGSIQHIRWRERERNKHLVKNIIDILIGNPITLAQDIDLK